MNPDVWKRIEAIHTYLHARQMKAVEGFRTIITKSNEIGARKVLVSFPYENIEVTAWLGEKMELFQDLYGVLSEYEMDQLSPFDYDEEHVVEDFLWAKTITMETEILSMWMMECFHEALKQVPTDIPYYYKGHYEDMEILDMKAGEVFYEQSEVQIRVKNLQNRSMVLTGADEQ